jgi:hypothetical protein
LLWALSSSETSPSDKYNTRLCAPVRLLRSNDDKGRRQERPSDLQVPSVLETTDVSAMLVGLPEAAQLEAQGALF